MSDQPNTQNRAKHQNSKGPKPQPAKAQDGKPASSKAPGAGPQNHPTPSVPRSAPEVWGTVADRRVFPDRRRMLVDGVSVNAQGERVDDAQNDAAGFERRRGPGRRLSDFTRSAEEGEMTKEQFLFLVAIDEFKKANAKPYPTWTDVLEVVRLLGYRKTMKSEISLRRAEDWLELPTAESNVRPPRWAEHGEVDAARRAARGRDAA